MTIEVHDIKSFVEICVELSIRGMGYKAVWQDDIGKITMTGSF